jgi:hypothetical protein
MGWNPCTIGARDDSGSHYVSRKLSSWLIVSRSVLSVYFKLVVERGESGMILEAGV